MSLKELARTGCRTALAAALALTAATTGTAQTQLSRYQPGVTAEGAVYCLPQTALRISVLVEKTTFEPGDFAPYAQRYLRMAQAGQEPQLAYRVVGISQMAFPIPDTAKVYAVRFDARSVASRMLLAPDGRLLGLNTDEVADVKAPAPFTPQPRPEWVNPRQYMSEEILSCGSTAKMAELTAQEIYDLRENRALLVKGQADFMPQDGWQMQLMLDELDRQDRSLSSLFLGTTVRDTTEHIVWLVPRAATPEGTAAQGTVATGQRQVLFRLSQLRGLVEPDDLSGAPFYITVDDISQLPEPTLVPAKKKARASEQGIYVNVPGRMRSTIYSGIDPILADELPAPQFGQTLLLSGSLFDKHYTTRLLLDPLTGAMQRLDADQPK